MLVPAHATHPALTALRWSPDALCLLTNTEENVLRVFEVPSAPADMSNAPAALCVRAGDSIYDCCWYPLMNSSVRETACFASTSRDQPVTLWDAFTGKPRALYRGYDQADELTAAVSIAFSPTGERLFCGYNRTVRVFDVSRPGRDCDERPTLTTTRHGRKRKREGLGGLLSCIDTCPDNSGFAGLHSSPCRQTLACFVQVVCCWFLFW